MSKLQYTPGPWEANYDGTIGHIKSLGAPQDDKTDWRYTPTVARYDKCAISIPSDEMKANGLLIAKAPETYELFKELVLCVHSSLKEPKQDHSRLLDLMEKSAGFIARFEESLDV